jgi:hypothetical protein
MIKAHVDDLLRRKGRLLIKIDLPKLNSAHPFETPPPPTCPKCGHIAVPYGVCYKCLNCGELLECCS